MKLPFQASNSKKNPIVIDDNTTCTEDMWRPALGLFKADKEILQCDAWLNTNLICAAQQLLKKKFPYGGLQMENARWGFCANPPRQQRPLGCCVNNQLPPCNDSCVRQHGDTSWGRQEASDHDYACRSRYNNYRGDGHVPSNEWKRLRPLRNR